MKTVKYNKGSLDSAISTALRLKSDSPLYVFATHLGYTIDRGKPPFGQRYIEVTPSGEVIKD